MLKTMAVKIDDDTYNLAVACLDASFISVSPTSLKDCYLIINTFDYKIFEGDAVGQYLVVRNVWCSEDIFNEKYYFVEKELPGELSEVLPN